MYRQERHLLPTDGRSVNSSNLRKRRLCFRGWLFLLVY